MSYLWRMAFMFDSGSGDLSGLENSLMQAASAVRRAAGDAELRIGVADRHPDLQAWADAIEQAYQWRLVDGAIEISIPAARTGELAGIARAVGEILAPFAAPSTVEVMAGPMYQMVPPQGGTSFLSLAFKRLPGTTSQQFRSWWHDHHAGLAIPVLGETLLGYDQVHVDPAATAAVSNVCGVSPVAYDAYDNLTLADRYGFLKSISDADGMARLSADEDLHIDKSNSRYALMRRIG